jgi:hypothetical protein
MSETNQDLCRVGEESVGMITMWKVSHGKVDFGTEEREHYLSKKQVLVHSLTKEGQGKAFAEEMKVGDLFYLCLGNDHGIKLVGKVTSDADECSKAEGWLQRSYDVIRELEKPQKYSGMHKGWSPNYNSTCKLVPKNELELFEKEILQKYFEMSLADLSAEVPR